jgi:hypothetical protein
MNEFKIREKPNLIDLIKVQLNADHCPNMAELLVELEQAKAALT